MPFDPTKPANHSPLDAGEMRDQLNALKALMDAMNNLVPIGAVLPWFKDTPGVPPLPANFVECNGQFLDDAESPLDGQLIPAINVGSRLFVRGDINSGATGGNEVFATAGGDLSGSGPSYNFVTIDFSPGATPIPPYVSAVYVIRVK